MQPKQGQVLEIEPPQELRFYGPFTAVSKADLTLFNPSDKRVLFKVKTTAPKRYCVRPNSGLLEPDEQTVVSVMLQPLVDDPRVDPKEKNKHKFMVQSMFAPEGPIESHEALWKSCTPDQLMDSKLRCMFITADDTEDKSKIEEVKSGSTDISSTDKTTLADSLHKLQNENIDLKKALQQAQSSASKSEGLIHRKPGSTSSYSSSGRIVDMEPAGESSVPTFVYIIVALILGFIIGKFVL